MNWVVPESNSVNSKLKCQTRNTSKDVRRGKEPEALARTIVE
jgi:hypothetical protein